MCQSLSGMHKPQCEEDVMIVFGLNMGHIRGVSDDFNRSLGLRKLQILSVVGQGLRSQIVNQGTGAQDRDQDKHRKPNHPTKYHCHPKCLFN